MDIAHWHLSSRPAPAVDTLPPTSMYVARLALDYIASYGVQTSSDEHQHRLAERVVHEARHTFADHCLTADTPDQDLGRLGPRERTEIVVLQEFRAQFDMRWGL